jgi:hypothetical protein
MISKTLFLGLLATASGFHQICEAQSLTISVQVIDNYGAPKGVVSAAQRDAARILAAAGVRLDWQQDPTPGGMSLKLVARKVEIAGVDALGYAFLRPTFGCNCAHLVYPEIERSAQRWEGEVSTILGAAMAHEIGHLLLSSNAHSSSGVMTANFGHKQIVQASRGELLFTAEQAGRIRAQVALQCCTSTTAGSSSQQSETDDATQPRSLTGGVQ